MFSFLFSILVLYLFGILISFVIYHRSFKIPTNEALKTAIAWPMDVWAAIRMFMDHLSEKKK